MQAPEISIDIDTGAAGKKAQEAAALLRSLRSAHDLTPFEFTNNMRIAPFEVPHSHPVLTLSTAWNHDADRFLAMYVHEQMHWYLGRYDDALLPDLIAQLGALYPDAPSGDAEGALSDQSVFLHLIVNWLELHVLETLIGWPRALATADRPPVYPWCYRTVIRDRDQLGTMYRAAGLVPMPG